MRALSGVEMEKLYIVDDHKMLLNGLKAYLEENSDWDVAKTFTSQAECLECLAQIQNPCELPQIIIVDVQLRGESGFDLVERITKNWPQIK